MADFTENTQDAFVTAEWGQSLPDLTARVPPEETSYNFQVDSPEEPVEVEQVDPPVEIEQKSTKVEKSEDEKKIAELAYRAKEAEKREKAALLKAEMALQSQHLQPGMDQDAISQVFQQAQVEAEYRFNLQHLDRKLTDTLGTEYRSVVDSFNQITGPQPQFQHALLDSLFDEDNAPEVVKHLVDNPNEIHRLYSLSLTSPHKMGKEIGKMSAAFDKKEVEPKTKPVSKMPPPVTEVGGGSSSVTSTPHPDKMSIEEYQVWRIAQRKKQGLRF